MHMIRSAMVFSWLALASVACGSSSTDDAANAPGAAVHTATPSPTGSQTTTTPGGTPGGTTTTTTSGELVLPAATEVKVTVGKQGTLSALKGGDFAGSWVADGARMLLPSSLAALIKLDKSGGTVTASGVVRDGKVKIGAKAKITLQAVLGQPQTVEADAPGDGTYKVTSNTHLAFTWTTDPSKALPPEVDYSVEGDKAMLRWNEDIDGLGTTIVEVDLHRAR